MQVEIYFARLSALDRGTGALFNEVAKWTYFGGSRRSGYENLLQEGWEEVKEW